MKRGVVLALLGWSLVGATVAVARPLADPAPWVLPVNVFAKAKAGDWTILEGDAVLRGKLVHEREIIRVGSVKGGVVEVQLFEGAAEREGWFLSFPVDSKRGPDTNLVFDLPSIATDLTTAKASCTLGGETFACTEVTYRTPTHEVTVRMAPRVRGSGIVSFAVVKAGKPTWTMTAIGYGTAGKVAWGAGPPRADLEAWDGGARPTTLRAGTEPASKDVYDDPAAALLGIPPHAEVASCKAAGGLDPRAVSRALQGKLQPLEDCYSDELAARPAVGGGAVELSFTVDEGQALELAAAGAAAPAIKACVTGALDGVEVPQPDGGRATAVCTLAFDPGKRAAPAGTRSGKRKLVTRAHPARGGPDLRGLQRIP